MNKTQQEVWDFIQRMNRTWTVENNPDALSDYFHENMVAITATDANRSEGRAQCVASWKHFTQQAKIIFWKEEDPRVQLYGNDAFAVVTYYFDMSFEMGGNTINMKGRDMFSLIKEGDKWLVVADQFSPMPPVQQS